MTTDDAAGPGLPEATSSVMSDRLQDIRSRIERDQYAVDPQAVAQAILAALLRPSPPS